MKISFSGSLTSNIDLLICPVFKNDKILKNYDIKLKKIYNELLNDKLISGEKGESETIIKSDKNLPKKICFIGFGEKDKLLDFEPREIIGGKIKHSMSKKVKRIGLFIPSELEKYFTDIVEGACLVNYTAAKFKTGKDSDKANESLFDELIIIISNENKFKKAANEALVLSDAVNRVRDLVNGPPNYVNVETFAENAKNLSKSNAFKITILDKRDLERMKMGAFLAVNRGSDKKGGAKMLIMEYCPKGLSKELFKKPVLLVGKGLIFDSGGYNLKPQKGLDDMHQDKAGGATVLGVLSVLNKLNIKRRVIGIVPLTENLLDAEAYKPSEVFTSYSGKTIEIRNTDAEGRMILADALSYGIKMFKPEYTIDLATLTGACMVALGDRYAGIMGNNKKLIDDLIKCGNETDELLWELPMHRDFKEAMKGRVADIRNIDNGTSALAGASKAAAFLEYFVEDSKWAHLDIAGVAFMEKPKAYDQAMATGFGVRLLVNFLSKN